MAGYTTPFPVTSSMENYFIGTPVATNCTAESPTLGIQSQTCDLSYANPSGSVTYSVNPVYFNQSLDVLFSLSSTPTQTVSITPLNGSIMLTDNAIFSPTVFSAATVTNVSTTAIVGDVDMSPGTSITGFPPGIFSGAIHVGTDALAVAAAIQAESTYATAVTQTCTTDLSGQDLGGKTLAPGVYCFSSSAQLTGALTLSGESTSKYVFQIATTLTTAASASVTATNNIIPANIVWVIGTAATFGTGTTFYGLVDSQTAITDNGNSNIRGYLWGGAGVTLDNTSVSPY